MKISTTPYYNHIVPAFEVEIPLSDLDREYYEQEHLWKDNLLVDSETHPFDSKRSMLDNDAEDAWKVLKYMTTNMSQEVIVDEIAKVWEANENMFYKIWPYDKNRFSSPKEFVDYWVFPASNAGVDRPGYRMHPHYDNRVIFGNIIVNLTDNDTSTVFHPPFVHNDELFRAPLEKGKGIFFMNSEDTYHNIVHEGKLNRFTYNVSLILKQQLNNQ